MSEIKKYIYIRNIKLDYLRNVKDFDSITSISDSITSISDSITSHF
jgi:hypothetical protein